MPYTRVLHEKLIFAQMTKGQKVDTHLKRRGLVPSAWVCVSKQFCRQIFSSRKREVEEGGSSEYYFHEPSP